MSCMTVSTDTDIEEEHLPLRATMSRASAWSRRIVAEFRYTWNSNITQMS
jgi:hypothetical protein